MRYLMTPRGLALCAAIALTAGCSTTSPPVSAGKQALSSAARAVAGTSLIGAKGATPGDQDAIDDTAAGLCAAKAWTPSECARHQKKARE